MKPSTMALTVVVFALAAGCIGLGDGEMGAQETVPSNATAESVPESILLEGCQEHFASFTVPEESIEAYLPEGFEPAGGLGMGLEDGMAVMLTVGLACTFVKDGSKEHVNLTWQEVDVEPPEAYRSDAVDYYGVVMSGATTSTTLAVAHQEAGIAPMQTAHVGISVAPETPAAWTGHVDWETREEYGHLLTSTSGPLGEGAPGSVRLFGVQNVGESPTVAGAVDLSWGSHEYMEGTAVLETFDGPVTVEETGYALVVPDVDVVIEQARL